jgi:peptidoglycan/LPS O-acetylase OafA/YrhL
MATTTVVTRATKRLDSLTGVRFLAALIVFGFHARFHLPDGQLFLFSAGMTGVSLFYILSGFVMAWVYKPDDTVGAFYRRRFARVYPAYFVAVLMAISVSLIMRDFEPVELVAFTLLQTWSPDTAVHYAASPVFWSLSCEAFFYLLFPFVAGRISRLGRRQLLALAAGCIVAVIANGVVALGRLDDPIVQWLVYIFPPTRSLEFVLGIALGFLVRGGLRLRIQPWMAVALAVAVLIGAAWAPPSLRMVALTVIPFAVLILALASRDVEGRRGILAGRTGVALGAWSYCFYLIHGMLQGWTVRLATPELPAELALIVAFGLSIVGAWLMHRLIELPAERLLRPKRSAARLDAE